jgi:hypothetical protein
MTIRITDPRYLVLYEDDAEGPKAKLEIKETDDGAGIVLVINGLELIHSPTIIPRFISPLLASTAIQSMEDNGFNSHLPSIKESLNYKWLSYMANRPQRNEVLQAIELFEIPEGFHLNAIIDSDFLFYKPGKSTDHPKCSIRITRSTSYSFEYVVAATYSYLKIHWTNSLLVSKTETIEYCDLGTIVDHFQRSLKQSCLLIK